MKALEPLPGMASIRFADFQAIPTSEDIVPDVCLGLIAVNPTPDKSKEKPKWEGFYLRYGTTELRTVLGNLNNLEIPNLWKSQEIIISNYISGNDLEMRRSGFRTYHSCSRKSDIKGPHVP
jgi:hypothetical protein